MIEQTCTASKTIQLAERTEVHVVCGLPDGDHPRHLAQDTREDGVVITFRWPA